MASTIDPSFITSAPVSKTGMKQQLQIAKDEITQLQDVLLPLKLDKAGGTMTGSLTISGMVPEIIFSETDTGITYRLLADGGSVEFRKSDYSSLFAIYNATGHTHLCPVTGNVLIGAGAQNAYRLSVINTAIAGGAPTTVTGTDPNVICRMQIGSVAYDTGAYLSGAVWLQARQISDYTTNYPLIIQPNGGFVGFGLANPGYPVTVQAVPSAAALRLVGRASDNISSLSFANNAQNVENALIQSQSSFLSFQVNNSGALANRFIIPGNGPLTIDGKALQIQRAAEQATTSGSAIDFTGIPAGVRRITIMLDFVSIAASDTINLQLGDSGGIETTGYSGFVGIASGTSAGTISTSLATAYSLISGNIIATDSVLGIIELVNQSGNKWAMKAKLGRTGTSQIHESIGFKTLSDVLDRLRIRTDTGVAFDAGSINIMWEF